jgi:hypothetical protein
MYGVLHITLIFSFGYPSEFKGVFSEFNFLSPRDATQLHTNVVYGIYMIEIFKKFTSCCELSDYL